MSRWHGDGAAGGVSGLRGIRGAQSAFSDAQEFSATSLFCAVRAPWGWGAEGRKGGVGWSVLIFRRGRDFLTRGRLEILGDTIFGIVTACPLLRHLVGTQGWQTACDTVTALQRQRIASA